MSESLRYCLEQPSLELKSDFIVVCLELKNLGVQPIQFDDTTTVCILDDPESGICAEFCEESIINGKRASTTTYVEVLNDGAVVKNIEYSLDTDFDKAVSDICKDRPEDLLTETITSEQMDKFTEWALRIKEEEELGLTLISGWEFLEYVEKLQGLVSRLQQSEV